MLIIQIFILTLYQKRKNMIANNIEPFEPTHPGSVLKEEIEYRGISQKQLAVNMGVSYLISSMLET